MALQISKETQTGASGNYWKIHRIELYSTFTVVFVHQYVDVAARQAGKQSLSQTSYSFTGEENPCTPAALETESAYILCYTKLKTLPEFTGATDV